MSKCEGCGKEFPNNQLKEAQNLLLCEFGIGEP